MSVNIFHNIYKQEDEYSWASWIFMRGKIKMAQTALKWADWQWSKLSKLSECWSKKQIVEKRENQSKNWMFSCLIHNTNQFLHNSNERGLGLKWPYPIHWWISSEMQASVFEILFYDFVWKNWTLKQTLPF